MARPTTTPAQLAEALAMRAAGYSVLAISQRLGISTRTLHRHFNKHGTAKGAVQAELIEVARQEMVGKLTSIDELKVEAARLIADNLAHARHLREIMMTATEQMKAASLKDAVLVMRAAAAYATATKLTSDMLRHSLALDRVYEQAEIDEIPELIIRDLSEEQIGALRAPVFDPDNEDGADDES